jgi:multidrug efflux pump subunit AcrA (membrane-fusion protein)
VIYKCITDLFRAGALLLLVGASTGCQDEIGVPALLEIPYVTAETQNVKIPIDVVGETKGSTDVTIRARVDGVLDGMHFEEGEFVGEGDLLYTLDPQPFEAKLAGARAQLAQANTTLAKTSSNLDRIRPLAEMKAVSAQDLDAAVASYEAAQSFVDAANAQVELAAIELGYTSRDLSDLVDGDSKSWGFFGNIFAPIFNSGQLKSAEEAQRQRVEQARLKYEPVVLEALRDVDDSLTAVRTFRQEHTARLRQLDAPRGASMLSRARYDGGVVSYLEVLDSERSLFQAEILESETRQLELSAVVSLYRALAGGWPADEET